MSFKPTHKVVKGPYAGVTLKKTTESAGTMYGEDSESKRYAIPVEHVEEIQDTDVGFRELQKQLHKDSLDSGWWTDERGFDLRDHPFTFPTKAMLIVTEVSEAIQGDRKDIADDHLPQYPMRAVELADVQIRLMDLAEAYGIDLLEIIKAKQAYNRKREDHKPENRVKKGGKRY